MQTRATANPLACAWCALLVATACSDEAPASAHSTAGSGGAAGVASIAGSSGAGTNALATAGSGGATAGSGSMADHDAALAQALDAGGSESDHDAGATWTSQPVSAPPTYMGTQNGGSACDTQRATQGFEPVDPAQNKHPLFLYFVGTNFSASDKSSLYDCEAGAAVTEAMARRGFVALSVDYDNGLSLSSSKLSCVFDTSKSAGLLAVACQLPNVDCELGIATWGHSQGALMAHAASNYDARVRAVWTTGYGGNSGFSLPSNRLRVVNGEADGMNADRNTILKAAGLSASECPDTTSSTCLRADGSGFMLVRKADCQLTAADHCWFSKLSCGASAETLEPNWTSPTSDKPFALEANADWMATTLARP